MSTVTRPQNDFAIAPSASAQGFQYLFGPVSSRRLGRSLGVDLLPYKTCSLDCVYCECGPTTSLTAQRAELVPVEAVLAELDRYLDPRPQLDYVTFSGSGEPTLHFGLGRIIAHLKERHASYKVAVLSNGTLFPDPAARQAVLSADLLVPSLDGATKASFTTIDRPAPGIDVESVIQGLVALRKQYRGTFVLEIFIVPGVNDSPAEIAALKQAALRIAPDAIQLNRLDRPGILPWVKQASDELLASIHNQLRPLDVVEVRRRQPGEVRRLDDEQVEAAILGRLAERSFDTTTLAFLLGLHEGLVAKHVRQMLSGGRLREVADPLRDVSAASAAPSRLVVALPS